VVLSALPLVYPSLYWLTVMSYLVGAGVFALSYDLVLGQTGILSFGQAASFGIGAYGVYWVMKAGYPFELGVVAAILLGALVNLAMGSALLRVKGVYFAMFTLAFAEVIYLFLSNQTSLTGGTTGEISPRPQFLQNPDLILGFSAILIVGAACLGLILISFYFRRGEKAKGLIGIVSLAVLISYSLYNLSENVFSKAQTPIGAFTINAYLLSVAILFISYYFVTRLMHSPVGAVLIAVRENDERTSMIGFNTFRYKLASMAISGLFAGLAGAMIGSLATFIITPDFMSANYTVDVLLYSILGGIGTLVGPILGAFIIEFLHFNIGYISEMIGLPSLATWWMLIIGIFYIAVVLFLPYGIVGTISTKGKHALRYLRRLIVAR
jgi:branched-chain amino acid transport system permease protein